MGGKKKGSSTTAGGGNAQQKKKKQNEKKGDDEDDLLLLQAEKEAVQAKQEIEIKKKEQSKVLPSASTLSKTQIRTITPAVMDLFQREYHWFLHVFPPEKWKKNHVHKKNMNLSSADADIPWGYKNCTLQLALVLAGTTPCCCISDMICEDFGPTWGKEVFEPWLKHHQEVLAPLKIKFFYNKREEEPNRGLVIFREGPGAKESDFEPALKIPFETVGTMHKQSTERLRKVYGYPSHMGYLQLKVVINNSQGETIVNLFGENVPMQELFSLCVREIVAYSFFVDEDSGEDFKAGVGHCKRLMATLKNFGVDTSLSLMHYAYMDKDNFLPSKSVAFAYLALYEGNLPQMKRAVENNPAYKLLTNTFCPDAAQIPHLAQLFANEWPKTTAYELTPEEFEHGTDDAAKACGGGVELQRIQGEDGNIISVRALGPKVEQPATTRGPRKARRNQSE